MADAIQPRRVFWTRMLRVALLLVVLFWFGRYAHVRITTPPADPEKIRAELFASWYEGPAQGADPDLTAALAAIPESPLFNEPAPPGMHWVWGASYGRWLEHPVDVTDVNRGNWDLSARPYLRVAVAYLTSSPMKESLERVRGLLNRPWPGLTRRGDSTQKFLASIRNVGQLFVARARYRQAHLGEVEGAWMDLKTLIECSRSPGESALQRSISVLCEGQALNELMIISTETDFSSTLAADMELSLSGLPSMVETALESIAYNTMEVRFRLRCLFTDDGAGNGWFVLGTPVGEEPRSRVWNLASFLYNDLRTVEAKYLRHVERIQDAPRLPWSQVLALRDAGERPPFGLLDGPHVNRISDNWFGMCSYHTRVSASRRAARVMIALNRYRAVHGRYPGAIDELSPEFRAILPQDPFCAGPFHYRVQDDGSYVLYSCGPDGIDNGGLEDSRRPLMIPPGSGRLDDIYPRSRGEPIKLSLEPDDPSVQHDAADTGDSP